MTSTFLFLVLSLIISLQQLFNKLIFYFYFIFPNVIVCIQIEKPLQKHGARLEDNEKYCGSCFGAEEVSLENLQQSSLVLILFYIFVYSVVVNCFNPLYILWLLFLNTLQTDDACCNSCEEVREAYRKKGWGLSDPESIDQVILTYLL